MLKTLQLLLFLIVSLTFSTAHATGETSIHMVALFNGKAMLSINGSKAKIIKAGDTYKGVKLISSTTKEATIELDGRKEVMTLNSAVVLAGSLGGGKPSASDTVNIWANEGGFFSATGAINGQRLEFLVDTGASIIVLSSYQANRIGLEYRNGQRSMATTASGRAPMYVFEAREVSFDGITLNSITTGVIEGRYPEIPLLGMSFLERVDMNRSGNKMTLKKRF